MGGTGSDLPSPLAVCYLEKKWTVGLGGDRGRSYLGVAGLEQITREVGLALSPKVHGLDLQAAILLLSPHGAAVGRWAAAMHTRSHTHRCWLPGEIPLQGGGTTRGSSSECGGW